MNSKNPKPTSSIRVITNLTEEYAEIMRLRAQLDAAQSDRSDARLGHIDTILPKSCAGRTKRARELPPPRRRHWQ
jgi:hypothetical protein